ncbi:MAG TPA: OsmC family protein [Acidimicrobiales bacterium]
MTTTDPATIDNGVDVAALLGAREAMTGAPAAAQFTWKATNHWVHGTHSRTSIDTFFGVGAEQSHHTTFNLDTDHPEIFAAADQGVTPVEMVLAGLAGCLTAGVASVAQNRGVQLRSVMATLQGSMDLAGILGIDPDVRNGFSSITVSYDIDADASREEIEGIVAQSQKRSAVFDVITNPTNVRVTVA